MLNSDQVLFQAFYCPVRTTGQADVTTSSGLKIAADENRRKLTISNMTSTAIVVGNAGVTSDDGYCIGPYGVLAINGQDAALAVHAVTA